MSEIRPLRWPKLGKASALSLPPPLPPCTRLIIAAWRLGLEAPQAARGAVPTPGPIPKPPLNLLVSPQSLAQASHARRLQTWMQIKTDGALSACLGLPTCSSQPAVHSQIGKMRGPSAGQSVAQRPQSSVHSIWDGKTFIYYILNKIKPQGRQEGGYSSPQLGAVCS